MKERKFEEKVLQEIEIHSKLCHPNVIKLLDHFSYSDNIYLVLELCENDTVKRYLDENGRLSEREGKKLFSYFCVQFFVLVNNSYIKLSSY